MGTSMGVFYAGMIVESFYVNYTISPYINRFVVHYTVIHGLDEGGVPGFITPPQVQFIGICLNGGEPFCGYQELTLERESYSATLRMDIEYYKDDVIALGVFMYGFSAFPLKNHAQDLSEQVRTGYATCTTSGKPCKY
jgi:hypothetical protein